MCCLRFEDEAYKDLRKELPKLNSQVEFEGERFKITSMNVIAKNCKLENRDHAIFISLDDLIAKGKYNKPVRKEESEEESVAV
jgi:cell fate regulator YaaT (PSP1 superfamily)